jgi:hypothetical protein
MFDTAFLHHFDFSTISFPSLVTFSQDLGFEKEACDVVFLVYRYRLGQRHVFRQTSCGLFGSQSYISPRPGRGVCSLVHDLTCLFALPSARGENVTMGSISHIACVGPMP